MDEIVASDNEKIATPTGVAEASATAPDAPAPVASDALTSEAAPRAPRANGTRLAPLIALAAWAVPGLGHALLGRWGRALGFFVAVGGLAITGYLMRGELFPPHSDDPFGTVGFLADAGAGIFYFLAHFFEAAGPEIGRAAGDYGTRFIAAAGIVNVLGAFDAYEIARRRRS